MLALLLDFDGTIADSLATMRFAYEQFLASVDRQSSDEEFRRLNGPPLLRVVEMIKREHGLHQTVPDLLVQYRRLLDELKGQILPAEGAKDLLLAARQRRLQVALVTSAAASSVEAWLTAHSLDGFVHTVVGGDCVPVGKPDPAPYVLALKKLSCVAEDAVAVEDSPQGAQSAVSAGIRTYGLSVPREEQVSWPAVTGFVTNLKDITKILDA